VELILLKVFIAEDFGFSAEYEIFYYYLLTLLNYSEM